MTRRCDLWTGGGQYWYGLNDQGFGNRGMECDNRSKYFGATPMANPTIQHVTLIGSGDQGPEPQGMMLTIFCPPNSASVFKTIFSQTQEKLRASGFHVF
jgi:hypothetical protein